MTDCPHFAGTGYGRCSRCSEEPKGCPTRGACSAVSEIAELCSRLSDLGAYSQAIEGDRDIAVERAEEMMAERDAALLRVSELEAQLEEAQSDLEFYRELYESTVDAITGEEASQ